MTTEEKKKELIELEWSFFQAVQNEGRRADCQNDPETFYIMRKSQFDSWNAALIDSYLTDLRNRNAAGENPIAEKYARMLEDTAPERFFTLCSLLPTLSSDIQHIITEIVRIQLNWMNEYVRLYPHLSSGNRIVHKEQAQLGETSFETYLRGELSTYSLRTLTLYLDYVKKLKAKNANLVLITMTHTVQYYGYKNLQEAERA